MMDEVLLGVKILRYPHEKESGRTSSVAQHFIRKRIIKEEVCSINYDDKINSNTNDDKITIVVIGAK